MTFSTPRYPLLIGLILSLLVHLTSLLLSPPSPPDAPQHRKPMLIEVQPREPQRETALPDQPQQSAPQAKRQGVVDQQVAKEQAPKGNELEDSSPTLAQPPTEPQPVQRPKQPKPAAKPKPTETVRQSPVAQPTVPIEVETQPKPERHQALPNLDQLLQSATNAAADITREAQTKHRPDVESGDELLLNMKQDKLFSFFSRFKKQIYAVWNYPEESINRRQQGVALLKIVINRDGSVEDVDLVSASGHERLDREAIAAIFKAQPYGRLPDSYPDEQLTIMAYFEYVLGLDRPRIYRQ